MLYYLIRPLTRLHFIIFFRKIFLSGIQKLPRKGPIILAVNHPTAFLDPAIIASFAKPSQNFLLRGDVFTTPFYRWLLDQIHTIPIFRFRDGFGKLKNNESTFEYCYQLLQKEEYLLILAEGQTKFEKRLRPIQKGTARLAFGAYEKFGLDTIRIIPVGVNFTNALKTRSTAMIDFGEPIEIKDYLEVYGENPRRAIKLITDAITSQLQERVVHVDADEDARLADQLLDIQRNNREWRVYPIVSHSSELLKSEMDLSRKINAMPEADKEPLRQTVKTYFDGLKKRKLNDLFVAQPNGYTFWNTCLLILAALPALLGLLFHLPVVQLSKFIANKKVKRKEFYSSIRYGVMLFGTLFYYLLLLIICLLIGHGSWMILLIMPFIGFIAMQYRDLWWRWNGSRRFLQLPAKKQNDLQKKRQAFLAKFD